MFSKSHKTCAVQHLRLCDRNESERATRWISAVRGPLKVYSLQINYYYYEHLFIINYHERTDHKR